MLTYKNVAAMLKKVRSIVHHIGAFEGSYPRLLKGAPVYTRSHLIVIYEILPQLRLLLRFCADAIPIIIKAMGVATHGKADLEKISEHLTTINKSSETAVTEIFGALDQVMETLRKISQDKDAKDDLKKQMKGAESQLMAIMNALQFQDITSQKIEATNALLANLGDGLVALIRDLGVEVEDHSIHAREGAFDAEAAFNREQADTRQSEIDGLLETGMPEGEKSPEPSKKEKPKKRANGLAKAPTPEKRADAPVANNGAGDAVSVEDIDALFSTAPQGAKSGAEGIPDGPMDQSNIDKLLDQQ